MRRNFFLKGTTESAVRQHYIRFCKEHCFIHILWIAASIEYYTLRHSNMTLFHWMITTTTRKTKHTQERTKETMKRIYAHTKKKKEEKSTLACRKDGSIHWTVAISVVNIVWSSMIRYVRGMVVKRELCKMCLIFTSLLTWQPRNQEMEKEETKRIKRKTYTLKRISHLFMNENAQQIKTIHVE